MVKLSFRQRFKRNRRFFLILIGLFLLVEFILSQVGIRPEYTYFYTKSDSGFWNEDPELFWIDSENIQSNLKQINGISSDKLIYCFGGSIVRGDFADTNFCREAEYCLPDGYKVVNFATSGYTSHQSLILFERMLKEKRPGLTIVCHGWNDVSNGPASDIQMALRNSRLSTKALYLASRSRLVQLWRRLMRKTIMPDPYSEDTIPSWVRRVETDQFRINLSRFRGLAMENDVRLLFMSQGVPGTQDGKWLEPYFNIMQDAAKNSETVRYLDVQPFLAGLSMEKFGAVPTDSGTREAGYLYIDLCHLNEFAHKQVGRRLCDFIKAENLL